MEAQDSAVITDESEALESEETVAESKEEDVLKSSKAPKALNSARKSTNY